MITFADEGAALSTYLRRPALRKLAGQVERLGGKAVLLLAVVIMAIGRTSAKPRSAVLQSTIPDI